MVTKQRFDNKQYQDRIPLKIQVRHPDRQSMYCMKCKKMVNLQGTYKKLKNGATAIVAPHSCGVLVYKIVGRFDFETEEDS